MDQTDVKAITISGSGVTPFTSGGTSQVFTSSGRLKGFWVLPGQVENCYIELYDGTSTSDPLVLKIGSGKASGNDALGSGGMIFPQNGIRFHSGLFLRCLAITTDGSFQAITLFYD